MCSRGVALLTAVSACWRSRAQGQAQAASARENRPCWRNNSQAKGDDRCSARQDAANWAGRSLFSLPEASESSRASWLTSVPSKQLYCKDGVTECPLACAVAGACEVCFRCAAAARSLQAYGWRFRPLLARCSAKHLHPASRCKLSARCVRRGYIYIFSLGALATESRYCIKCRSMRTRQFKQRSSARLPSTCSMQQDRSPADRCVDSRAGHRAIYLSGGGVALATLGLPDLGVSTLPDVVEVSSASRRTLSPSTRRSPANALSDTFLAALSRRGTSTVHRGHHALLQLNPHQRTHRRAAAADSRLALPLRCRMSAASLGIVRCHSWWTSTRASATDCPSRGRSRTSRRALRVFRSRQRKCAHCILACGDSENDSTTRRRLSCAIL